MNKDISERIWATRYLMVLGIVVLHLPPYQPLSHVGQEPFDYIKAFFSHGVFRATVPVLTVISGFLVFHFQQQLKPAKLIWSKVKSILVPLIVWNVPLALAIFFIQKYGLFAHAFSATLYPFDIETWFTAITGAFGNPVNYPLNFLRDLFVLACLAPLMWQVLKRSPYMGLVLMSLVYYFNLDGPLVLRNSMLISFYIGALAAHQNWDLTRLDRFAVPLFILFLLICAAMVVFKVGNRELFRMVSPFMVWPAMSLVMKCKIGSLLVAYSRYSFFTFLSHGVVILAFWLAFNRFFQDAPYFIYWITAPVFAAILAIGLDRLLNKYLPRFSSLLVGGR